MWVEIARGSSPLDTAQHCNRDTGRMYGTLPSPFLLCVCRSIPHSNLKRLNVIILILQRRKLSLGEVKSFVTDLIAPK